MLKHDLSAPSCTPRPRQLRDPLILALARLTSFRTDTFVPMLVVIDATIREAGWNPDALPSSWTARSRSEGGDLRRNITLAYRYGYRGDNHTSRAANNPALTIQHSQRGQWALTAAGVALARSFLPVPMPSPRFFADPLMRALGKLSNHSFNPIARFDVAHATMLEAGYNPDVLPRGWDAPASNSQPKYQEILRWLARSMDTYISRPSRGFWALTQRGVEHAAQLNGVPFQQPAVVAAKPTGPNVTSKWLSKHLTPERGTQESALMKMMKGALIKHMSVSARQGLIDDHINNFIVRAIRRDSFAQVLSRGEDLPYSKVASYCVNSGRSDARDMGTDPVCREMLGARTERERLALPDPTSRPQNVVTQDTDGNIMPAADDTTYSDDALDFETVWRRVEDVVRDRKPDDWERYSKILALKAQGYTTNEIAAREGIPRNRAAKMLATVRQVVRESDSFAF